HHHHICDHSFRALITHRMYDHFFRALQPIITYVITCALQPSSRMDHSFRALQPIITICVITLRVSTASSSHMCDHSFRAL
ncbi:hypothetical protein AVEN_16444-1, partial [Araneus ventricosus]